MITDKEHHIDADNENYNIPDYAVPVLLDEKSGWIRSEKNVLSGFFSMYQPQVVCREDQEYPYQMWFMGWPVNTLNNPQPLPDGSFYPGCKGGDAIFHARSKDLDNWEVYSRKDNGTGEIYWDTKQKATDWVPVLTCQDIWYDDLHVGDPSIVFDNGTYYMAYSSMGTDLPNPDEVNPWDDHADCIMGAVSNDGIHWERSKEPIMIWKKECGFDENKYADSYYGGYQRPSIMYENGKWRMWYDYEAGKKGISIGYAENEGDFLNPSDWKQITPDTEPCFHLFVDIDVVKIGKIYYAYGDPVLAWFGVQDAVIRKFGNGWPRRQITEMQSYDGLSWKVTGYFRPDSGYEANQIPQVFLDHKNKRVCIFYATQRGTRNGPDYDWHWDNFRYMYKYIKDFK